MWEQIVKGLMDNNPYMLASAALLGLGVIVFIYKTFFALLKFQFSYHKLQNEFLPLIYSEDLAVPIDYLKKHNMSFPYNHLQQYLLDMRKKDKTIGRQIDLDLLKTEYDLVRHASWFLTLASLCLFIGFMCFLAELWTVFTTMPMTQYFENKITFVAIYNSYGVLAFTVICSAILYGLFYLYRNIANKTFEQCHLLMSNLKHRLENIQNFVAKTHN